jgi:hypothetical protein
MDILGETKDATQILFRITGAHLTAMSDTTLIGTFVAPQAEIRLQENARLEGAAYGAILQLGLETEVIGRPAEALWIEWLLPQP